tara:strand:+ start:2242 stop:3000 length:759 start_codon:yes stop_codon:yes gene_type:complete
MNLIDTHCHIYYDNYKDNINMVLDRAQKNNISHIICVGVDLKSSIKCIELSDKHKQIYATVGYHPHESKEVSKSYLIELEKMLKHKKVVAIGETGLDYYYNHSNKKIQKKVFIEQLELAKSCNMPIIVHNRNADEDILDCIKKTNSSKGVIHCFASNNDFAKKILSRGYLISFTGLITFADDLIEVVKNTPINKIMIETDSPYLTPVPFRGKTNEPSMVKYIAQQIAKIKKISLDLVANETTKTAKEFFNLK